MLDLLRQSASGIVAKTLIGLLIISFGVWGVSGTILSGASNNVIEVGETRVDVLDFRLAYDNQLSRLSQQLQTRLSREQANAFGLEQNVISQLVSGAVLDESARKMGLGLSSTNLAELIGNDAAFQDASGRFSRERLDFVLRQVGMREQEFIENRKAIAIRNQIIDAASASVALPDTFLEAYNSYENTRRAFQYVVIGSEAVDDVPDPTESELQTYFEENKSKYQAPEYRKLTLVKLEAKDIARPEDVTTEEIEQAYESRKQQFTTAEKRRVQQLVFENREKADDASAKLASGANFDALLDELGKKPTDIDLGILAKSDLPDETVADAAFGATLNVPTEVVDGIFGPVIVRVTEIEPEKIKPISEVEEQLRRSIAEEIARDTLFDTHDRLEDERAAGDPITEAARKVGLTAVEVAAVDVTGRDMEGNPVTSISDNPTLLKEIFETEVGAETDPAQLGEGYIWYEVSDIIAERQKDYSEVLEEVRANWKAEKTAELVKAKAEFIVEKVSGGEELDTVLAAELPTDSLGQKISSMRTELIERGRTQEGFARSALDQAFNKPLATVNIGDADRAGNLVIYKVVEIRRPAGQPTDEEAVRSLNGSAADDLLTLMVEDLQAREQILINRQAIEVALTY